MKFIEATRMLVLENDKAVDRTVLINTDNIVCITESINTTGCKIKLTDGTEILIREDYSRIRPVINTIFST